MIRYLPFPMPSRRLRSRAIQSVIIALLTVHWAALIAMAGLPHLHEALHPEADHPHHECAVTLYAAGLLDTAPLPSPLPLPALSAFPPFLVEEGIQLPARFLTCGVLEHGPPAAV